MSREKAARILCVVLLLGFIAALLFQNSDSSVSAEEVFSAAAGAFETEELEVKTTKEIKKQFSLDESTAENVLFIASDSVMEVRELLVVEVKNKDDVDAVFESIESRVTEKKALFKNYAPEQSALLENYVLVKRGKFILYAVSSSPDKVVKAFKKAF